MVVTLQPLSTTGHKWSSVVNFTADVSKIMFSQASVCPTRGLTPNASRDRSYGQRGRGGVGLEGGRPGQGRRGEGPGQGEEVLVKGDVYPPRTSPPVHHPSPPWILPSPGHHHPPGHQDRILPPPPPGEAENQEKRSMSGRYASYWYAFLFNMG